MTTPTTEAGRKMYRYLDHIDPAEWEYEADIRAIEQQAADAATARLREAIEDYLRASDAYLETRNGGGHPGEPHDHILGDLRPPHDICDLFGECANCGGAQYTADDAEQRAMGALRIAVGQEPKPWEAA